MVVIVVVVVYEMVVVGYMFVLGGMFMLVELVVNYVMYGVLVIINFFGVNIILIVFNEVDYLCMWI